jgi:uncharacterized protein (UPF0335 family)
MPKDVRIVASGGTRDGKPFTDTLVRVVSGVTDDQLYMVNEVTTLIATYMARHPQQNYAEAESQIKLFLNIPPRYDLVRYAAHETAVYSTAEFARQSDALGGLEKFTGQLLQEMEREEVQHSFPSQRVGATWGGAFKWIGGNLASGIVGAAGAELFGWAMHDLFGVRDATEQKVDKILKQLEVIQHQLKVIQNQLLALIAKVDRLEREMRQVEWDLLAKEVYDAAARIGNRYKLLTGYVDPALAEQLRQEPAKFTKITQILRELQRQIRDTNVGVANDLIIIHNRLINAGNARGMLDLWNQMVIEHNGTQEEIWDFFSKMLMVQFQGYTLLIEAYHADDDKKGAKTSFKRMSETIKQQLEQLMPMLERRLLALNAGCYNANNCPYNDILLKREFPCMELTSYYRHQGWDVQSLFQNLDLQMDEILGSLQAPPSYGRFTARVILNPTTKWGEPNKKTVFAGGLPLTFRHIETGKDYQAKGTWINPDEPNKQIWMLRYDFGRLPAGLYVLTEPTNIGQLGIFQPQHAGWCWFNPTTPKMSLGSYQDHAWIEVRKDKDGNPYGNWGGAWLEQNPAP